MQYFKVHSYKQWRCNTLKAYVLKCIMLLLKMLGRENLQCFTLPYIKHLLVLRKKMFFREYVLKWEQWLNTKWKCSRQRKSIKFWVGLNRGDHNLYMKKWKQKKIFFEASSIKLLSFRAQLKKTSVKTISLKTILYSQIPL